MRISKNSIRLHGKTMAAAVALAFVVSAILVFRTGSGQPANNNSPPTLNPTPSPTATTNDPTVDLTPSQLSAVKIEALGTRSFAAEKTALGNIDYNEDASVQVFSSYPGKIITASAELGEEVKKGQPLFTIESPDLIQAESTLIGAAANYDVSSKTLTRAKALGSNGIPVKELEQAASGEETADGALKAARDAVRVFGKNDAEIDQIVASRKVDAVLTVASPVTGRVVARNAQPGLLVQPGNAQAPYSVADLTTKWMIANVIESDSPIFHPGLAVQATLMAYPGRVFDGKISKLGASVDPVTHRVMVRCEIADPKDELRPGMLTSFVIRVSEPVESVAIPFNGVVRNGDGTMAVWVTTDRHRFAQRLVKLGLQQDGNYQVLDGLQRGELAVTDGAVFISNILYAPPTD